MTKEIAGAVEEWKFARKNTIEFIKGLGNNQLSEKLSRPGLDTFCKHFQEMINVQEAYINGIKSGEMAFDNIGENDSFNGKASVEELIKRMEEIDNELEQVIAESDCNLEIKWEWGERKTVTNHLCALSTHELFHIGQLVGFCYASNIKIPQAIVELWALSPQ